ncbi:MAG: aminotransferase class I/II-fold pyridoxal phosphate-dependent enzyme [Actinomycetota bacterium]
MNELPELDGGDVLHNWASELFPICRSLTGDGVRSTLRHLQGLLPELVLHEVPSGSRALDWTVPDEWNLRSAWIEGPDGERIIDAADHNLHVLGYSEPVDLVMTREELEPHLHSRPEQPDAIPYVTSYYARRWGFCLTQHQRDALGDGPFRVRIDATLAPGSLTYADAVLPGETDEEVLISSYVCHPSMANNELSGPVVATAIGRWLRRLPNRRYTYRIVLAPETIGALVYLERHLDHLRQRVRAGWQVTCVGDERAWSFMPSRNGDSLADRISRHVLDHAVGGYDRCSFLDRGSDERQYCAPGVDLPLVSIMRSRYGTYPEYHTSLDDLSLVTPTGLGDSLAVLRDCLVVLERSRRWRSTVVGEPQLGRRGLYPTLSRQGDHVTARGLVDVLAYADGSRDLVGLADALGRPAAEVAEMADTLAAHDLLEDADAPHDAAVAEAEPAHLPYGRQDVDETDIEAVVSVLRGDWLTQGPTIEAFERALAERVEARHAVTFTSGTAALHAAAWAAGLGPGDTVVTSPLTFMASANAARYVGALPQLVDLDDATWNLDLAAIPRDASAAIPVHYAGLPVDLAGAPWRPAVVIEDAAHALGAVTPDGPVGNCANSDLACFSFHPVKPITSGEGGAVTTNDAELADRLRRFRTHGVVRRPELGGWVYDVVDVGMNYRMTDLQAALGQSQLGRLDGFLARRTELADRYRTLLPALDVGLPPTTPTGFVHGLHLFPVLVPHRRRVFESLRAAGIGVQVHYVPVHHHSVSADIGLKPGDLPVCDGIYERLLSLPLHPQLTDRDQDRVVDALARALGGSA